MILVRDILTVVLIVAGTCFYAAGSIGLLRFPDPLTRLHALTKGDTLGLGLIVLGLLPWMEWPFGALKLITVWVLVLIGSAAVGQMIGGAVRSSSSEESRL